MMGHVIQIERLQKNFKEFEIGLQILIQNLTKN
jgi:hypothetical protein